VKIPEFGTGEILTLKLEYDVDGYTTCLGSVNDYTGDASQGSITSWCVRKLDEAGAINLGKLSMHEFGLGTSLNYSNWHLPLRGFGSCEEVLLEHLISLKTDTTQTLRATILSRGRQLIPTTRDVRTFTFLNFFCLLLLRHLVSSHVIPKTANVFLFALYRS
jgi:hypothetical protein